MSNSSSSSSSIIEEVFELLSIATNLENESRIEAATKYYEAIYLMKRFLHILPESKGEEATRQLVQEKVVHYERIAQQLMMSDSTLGDDGYDDVNNNNNNSSSINPRSPVARETFFHEDSSVVPIPASNVHPLASLSPKSGAKAKLQSQTTTRLIGQANQKLALALDLDEAAAANTRTDTKQKRQEAIEMYMQACESYLKALQTAELLGSSETNNNDTVATAPAVTAMLKRRLESTLDRVEQLKQLQQQQQQHPASPDSQVTTTSTRRQIVPHQRQADSRTTHTAASMPATAPSSSVSSLTAKEIEILKQSSLIASGLFLPWSDQDAVDLLAQANHYTKHGNSNGNRLPLYKDPDGFLPLSDSQKKHFARWARPSEIVQLRHKVTGAKLQTPVLVNAITPYTIKQQYVTDCSFVASLCICAAFERRFRKRLITSILYPQSSSGTANGTVNENMLVYNPAGKYMVKLWLNGVARCVTIDDYLPIDKYGNLLCSLSSSYSHPTHLELWVCLIEKAFLKLAGGGYGFPGSNSGVDLFSLTGWIPEVVLFAKDPSKVADYETHPQRAWERIFGACLYGDCLITVSSSLEMDEKEADAIGIVTGHAYAVLSVIETKNGTRLLQLKNPWAHKGWKGRFSSLDAASWKDPQFRAEVGYNPDLALQQDDGVFWICWQDVLQYFRNFHLSWNPSLFSHRTTLHDFWPKDQGPVTDTYNIGENPQYTLELSDQAIARNPSIWILLSRHVTKQEQLEGKVEDYLTVHVHQNTAKKERIWYPGRSGNCILTGAYTNSPQVLVRYDVTSQEDKYLTLVLSQYKKSRDLSYSLSIFATEDFSLSQPPKDLEHCIELNSAWTEKSAGGRYDSDNEAFVTNPMFAVQVPQHQKGTASTAIELRLSTAKSAAINAMLVPVSEFGQDINHTTGLAVIDSGKYRHGFCVTPRQLVKGGSYVLIVSNFYKGQQAAFQVKLYSSRKIKLKGI